MGRSDIAAVLIIGCLIMGNTSSVSAKEKDEAKPAAKAPAMQDTSIISKQQNIPKLPELPQLLTSRQTITKPRAQKSFLETTKFAGTYIKTGTELSGEKTALIEDAKGNEIALLINEKTRIYKKGVPIAVDDIKEGDKVVSYYEANEALANPARIDHPSTFKDGSNPTGIVLPMPYKEGTNERDGEEADIKKRNVLKYLFLVGNEPDTVNSLESKEPAIKEAVE